jgi:probable F420-dependent oxidoreductase
VQLGISPYGLRLGQYVKMAVDAETAGFESVWVADHLVVPARIDTPFPYAPDGNSGMTPGTEIFDPWVLLSFMAASTERIRLGPFVYILALRHPFVTAKAAASLQILSHDRLLLGAGVGWLAEEYAAMGLDFRRRGRQTAEAIELIRQLWESDTVSSDGAEYPFASVGMAPRPSSIPIHLGGHSQAAVDRATRLGDGWLGSPRPADTLESHLSEMLELIQSGLDRAGRRRSDFEITGALLGMPKREHLALAAELGLDRLIISPWGADTSPPGPDEVALQLRQIVDLAKNPTPLWTGAPS